MRPGPWFPRTKLLRPEPPDDLVVDPALLDRLVDAVGTVPLTLVRGAPGAGKTTIAAATAREIVSTLGPGGDVGWIRFDELDDDPGSLLDLLVEVFDAVVTGGCPAVRDLLAAGLPSSVDPRRVVGVLVNDLLAARTPDPAVVVLDDLHTINDPAAVAVLDYFIGNLPPTVHLLATSRTEPALSISLLRARGQLVEILDDDLRLGVEQAIQLLNGRLDSHLSTDEVAAIVAATGGWVTGVLLHGSDADALDRFLEDELVASEADDAVAFLVETSILDVVTPESAAHLTGRADAGELLRRLQQRWRLFISVVDPSRPAYRFHDLFAGHLRQRLAGWPPEHRARLHRGAADVVTSPARRIEHLITAGAWPEAAEAIDDTAGVLPRPAELPRIAAWARQVPREQWTTHPALGVLVGTAAAQRGDLGEAVPLLEEAVRVLDDRAFGRRWLAVRTLHFATNDHARFLPLFDDLEADPAFDELPPAVLADHHLSRAYGAKFAGFWAEVARRVDLAIGAAVDSGDTAAVEVLAQHLSPAIVAAPGVAQAIGRYTAWAADRFPDGPLLTRIGSHHQRSFLAFVEGRFDEAVREAQAALPLVERLGGLPYLRATFEWSLAGVSHAAGDDASAERVLRASLEQPETGDLDRELDMFRLALLARVLRRTGDVDALRPVVAELERRNARRYADFLSVSAASARAQLCLATDDIDGAITALRQAVALEDRVRVVPFLVVPRIDLALALARDGSRADAAAELAAARTRLDSWGARGLLAAAGPEVAPLLDELGDTTSSRTLTQVQSMATAVPVAVPDTDEVLSVRELEVLRLLGEGATNAQIAEALVISTHTAKTHVSHILTKLGARNRGEAVARARAHRLL